MGKGLALEFKNRFPQNYEAYKLYCNEGLLKPGRSFVWRTNDDKYIFNMATKDDWRNPSKIEYIENGLIELSDYIVSHNIYSIAIPKIGCGLGGLSWRAVKSLIVKYIDSINDLTIYLFE
jgi:O-acetyl-ADP-ribose deacetylase (regulator of RNase III)